MAARQRERRQKAHERAEKREARRSKINVRQRVKRWVIGGFVGFIFLLIVLSLVIPGSLGNVGFNPATSADQGVQVNIQANEVVEAGAPHPAYNTSPPTSGWRYDVSLEDVEWGARDAPVENEEQVSYLERGGVMVQYNCPDECPGLLEQLTNVVNRYPEGVAMAPYPDMDSAIALTAWSWIDTMENFDDARIDDFILRHLGNGPSPFR